MNHHRKLIPTYTERLVWGQGDGGGLGIQFNIVRPRPVVLTVCWEHWMPMARQALHIAGEHMITLLFGRLTFTRCINSPAGITPLKDAVSSSPPA